MKRQPFLTPLSRLQISTLVIMAGKAHKLALQRGAIDDSTKVEDYRRAGQMEAANVASLKDANQGHYLALRGHWWVVIGNLEQAFADFLAEGPQDQARRQMAYRLSGQVSHLADAIAIRHKRDHGAELDPAEAARQAWAYTQSLASAKYGGGRWTDLDAFRLEQLGFTVTNRANAMRGVGDSSRRNKSQRGSRKPAAEAVQPVCDRPPGLALPKPGLERHDRAPECPNPWQTRG